MKKGTRILKRYLSTFLVVLMSINTFAAVVGDNDGAAFITKAEFDSMKNDFQSQLDRYNSSIDNKIDGAIASYLSGVSIAAKYKVTLNGELKDVSIGAGYRCYNAGDLTERVGDCAVWNISSLIIVPRYAAWANIDDGVISAPLSAMDASLGWEELNPHLFLKIMNVPPNTSDWWEAASNDYLMGVTVVSRLAGTLGPLTLGSNRPLIFADESGVVTSFATDRILLIDSRYYKGTGYASQTQRCIYLYSTDGTADSAQPFAEYAIDSDVNIPGYGGSYWYSPPAFTVGPSYGSVRAVVQQGKAYNNNIFSFNMAPSDLIDAFADKKRKYYINEKINTTPNTREPLLDDVVVIRAETFGPESVAAYYSRPEVHFNQLITDTILDTDKCFSSDTNDHYKRFKIQYLRNKNFVNSDGLSQPYIYQGLPIYSAEKDGELEFRIKISTNYDSNALYWADPGTPSSKVKLRVKSSEFNIGTDTQDAVLMKVGTSLSPITSGTVAVSEATLTPGELTIVRLQNCKSGKTYFLRWYVDGFQYGGEITYLGEGYFTEEA